MIFAGTIATYGRGRAIVTGTGMQTLFGEIAQMLSNRSDKQNTFAAEPG